MNLLDGLVAAYVAYGAYRGRARGLGEEAYRLLRVGVALVAGCGLYEIVGDLLSRVVSLGTQFSGPVGFLGTMIGTWSVLRVAKEKMVTWLSTRYVALAETGGAIAGGLRNLVLVSGAMITAHLAGRSEFMADSWVGRLISVLVGN